jgi:tRNA (guanine37-N1)-methyltransferase
MRIDILTLFPEVFEPYLSASIVGRARSGGLVEIGCTNFRDFAKGVHKAVDDRPFGGGPGMVLMCPPLLEALDHVERTHQGEEAPTRILLTPQGERLTQQMAWELSREPWLVIVCGHYEGFDERIRTLANAREISIGDYVLSGGEPAAMVLVDAVVRLLPGALGHEQSAESESFVGGVLEYPQYTRPREYRGLCVPDVLLSGDHGKIAEWRKAQALQRTRERRPDLLQ